MNNLVKHSGQVFTPDYIVNLMLDELGYNGPCILKKHCVDNSCGDGAFICEIVRRYVKAYKQVHNSYDGVQSEIKEYVHGIELDIAAFEQCLNNVSSVLSAFGIQDGVIDLHHANTLCFDEFDGKMDYVVGNPPYVRVHNLNDSFNAVKEYEFANGGMTDLYLVFFEIGFNMLTKSGKLCYITPSSWLNSVAGSNLRSYIVEHHNLLSVIDLGHFQPFSATTYTMISMFQKGICNADFAFYEFNSDQLNASYVCNLTFDDICINGKFYLSDKCTLKTLRQILLAHPQKLVSVKNGFATLADKVFISNSFPFSSLIIPVIKASTGKWLNAFYPYDKNGKSLSKDEIFSDKKIKDYLENNKNKLLKDTTEAETPHWYLYGRTQALKDVYAEKFAINTIIKDVQSIKLNKVPCGCGVYSGLYILTEVPFETILNIILSSEFISYIRILRKYKSGGYYTFNSKDIEQYLNFKLSIK